MYYTAFTQKRGNEILMIGDSRFNGFRWWFRRILDDGIPVSSAFPLRGRCPEGADRALVV